MSSGIQESYAAFALIMSSLHAPSSKKFAQIFCIFYFSLKNFVTFHIIMVIHFVQQFAIYLKYIIPFRNKIN